MGIGLEDGGDPKQPALTVRSRVFPFHSSVWVMVEVSLHLSCLSERKENAGRMPVAESSTAYIWLPEFGSVKSLIRPPSRELLGATPSTSSWERSTHSGIPMPPSGNENGAAGGEPSG